MLEYRIATAEDIELMMDSRLEMLKEVNDLAPDHEYDTDFVDQSRKYFLDGDHTTVLVIDNGRVIACASMCYIGIMPTFAHPTGRRAHLMNVYTAKEYRRQGIGARMVEMLIDDAWDKGATEISLDATEAGRPLYLKCGFTGSGSCMTLVRDLH